jgi:putative ABC transport system substrate-binding protein
MTKGIVIGSLLTVFLLTVALTGAQQPAGRVPMIGIFLPDTKAAYASYVAAFLKGLDELGYVVGRNILIEYRYADGKRDRFPKHASDLVGLKVDAIVVVGGTLNVTRHATRAIPIVAATAGDLVADGYVVSLARPGGNITGTTNIDSELSAKRLELLKETLPRLSRLAVISHAGNRQDRDELKETRAAGHIFGVRIQSLEIKAPGQLPGAFIAMTEERAQAVIITNNSFTFANRKQLFELATGKQLPTMCGRDAFVEHGCIISYAGSRLDGFRRAAYFIDKILKGAKPADLPVQQPTKFELVINLKTAKQIGLTIPPNVLARADRVIQ